MKRRPAVLALLALLASVGATGVATRMAADGFPHREHDGLFPLCTGCHAGIETGDADRAFPDPTSCGNCHDGERRDRVEWSTPGPAPSVVRFTHPGHAGAVRAYGDPAPACEACHREPGAEERMAVVPAGADACRGCHAHEAPSHFARGRDCTACHDPLADVPGLPAERVADFPVPPDHDENRFLLEHGSDAEVARCATCHARESCERCHLNGDALEPIRALAPDERVARLLADLAPEYPEPPGHAPPSWAWEHGTAAREDASACATCHVRQGCASCHRDNAPEAVRAQPDRPEGDPRGVVAPTVSYVHPPGYAALHFAAAGADPGVCGSCHGEEFCTSCHDAPASPSFHLPNFLERHAPEAYSAGSDCASCHDREVFCRSCHTGAGLAGEGRPGVAFHTSRPFWLLGHGIAARQGLDGCVSCHRQSDCTRCHSATSGWRVNPHGPSFDAAAARDANPFSCIRCHLAGRIP